MLKSNTVAVRCLKTATLTITRKQLTHIIQTVNYTHNISGSSVIKELLLTGEVEYGFISVRILHHTLFFKFESNTLNHDSTQVIIIRG